MGTPYFGLINRVTADQFIDTKEYGELEIALFAGDGLVDPIEAQALDILANPLIYGKSPDNFIFENPEDLSKINLLLDNSAYTLERYVRILDENGLDPSNPLEKLKPATTNPPPDDLPTIDALQFNNDGTFSVSLVQGDQNLVWRYDGETDLDRLSAETYPFTIATIIKALIQFGNQEGVSEQEQEEAQSILKVIGTIYRQSVTGEKEKQQAILSGYLKGQAAPHPVDDNILNNLAKDKPVNGFPSFVKGLTPDTPSRNAIEVALQSLPKGAIDILRSTTTIHLLSESQLEREYYNTHPEQTDRVGNFDGLSFPDPKLRGKYQILLSLNLDPYTTAYDLVHEIGHIIYFNLIRKSGGDVSSGNSDDGLTGEINRSLFENLKQNSSHSIKTNHATIYGATTNREQFAENFAIYQMGKYGNDLPLGYQSVVGERADRSTLLNEFKEKNPDQYLLMAKLNQALEGKENLYPEDVFSWTAKLAAENFVKSHPGIINDQTEEEWLALDFDFATENRYDEINQIEDPIEKTASLIALGQQDQNFYPVQRDTITNLLFGLSDSELGPKLIKDLSAQDLETLIQQAMGGLADLFEEHSSDQVLKDELADLASYDPSNDNYNKVFMENSAIKEGVAQLVEKLHTKYPDDEDFTYDQALIFIQQKKYDEAIVTLKALIEKTSPDKKEGYLSTLADCQINRGHPEEAEKIYTEQGWLDSLVLFYQDEGNNGKLIDTLLKGVNSDNPWSVISLSWEEEDGLKAATLTQLQTQFPDKWKEIQSKTSAWLTKQATEPNTLSREDVVHIKQVYGIK